jgi:hypothetical protein
MMIYFVIITLLIYYITKQRVCETISIIKMLTISKNLVRPRELESFKGGKFNTLSLVDCYGSSSTSLVQMRANTHVSSSVTDVVDILDVNYDDLFCD